MLKRAGIIKLIYATLAVLAVLAVALIIFQFHRHHGPADITLPKIAAQALMSLAGVHQTATKDGKVQWELIADSAQLEAESGRMVLQMPQMDFFLDDGSRVHLTAEQGILHTRSNDMQVRGNVKVHNGRYTLVTEVLAYLHDRRILQTDEPVNIIGNDIELQAATLVFDLETNQAHFNGQVKGSVYEPPAI